MGGKRKSTEAPMAIKIGKSTFAVNMKIEAKDSTGQWFSAKILKLKPAEKELLVHFDGWNSRYDIWLSHNSPRIRIPVVPQIKTKPKEKEWRIGDRVVAKWGPASRVYPATISKIINETSVEITFYDGIKKNVVKNSLKADTEKLYRQYESSTVRKAIVSPPQQQKKEEETKDNTTTTQAAHTNNRGKEKRRLAEPTNMADYVVMDSRKRRKSRATTEENTKSSSDSKKENVSKPEERKNPAIPKVKLKLGEHTIAICTSREAGKNEKLIEQCGIDIEKKKNKSYVMFPTNDRSEEEVSKKKTSTSTPSRRNATTNKATKVQSTSNSKFRVKFPFGGSDKGKTKLDHLSPSAEIAPTAVSPSNAPSPSAPLDSRSQDSDDISNLVVETVKTPILEENTLQVSKLSEEDTIETSLIHVGEMKNEKSTLTSFDETKSSFYKSTKEADVSTDEQRFSVEKETILTDIKPIQPQKSTITKSIDDKNAGKRRLSERMEIKRRVRKESGSKQLPEIGEVNETQKRRKSSIDSKPSNEVLPRKGKSEPTQERRRSSSTRDQSKKTAASPIDACPPTTKSSRKEKGGEKSTTDSLSSKKTAKVSKSETKNFEQKYEMFKQKWKAEKERRRLMKDTDQIFPPTVEVPQPRMEVNIALSSYTSIESLTKVEKADGTDKITVPKEETLSSKPEVTKHKPKLKTTPATRFGKGTPVRRTGKAASASEAVASKKIDEQERLEALPVVHETQVEPTVITAAEPIVATTIGETTTTATLMNTQPSEVIVKKKGWPKGRPRKRKMDLDVEYLPDTSRTPNMLDTISFASMVSEERPSQKSRPQAVPKKKHMKEPPIVRPREEPFYSNISKPEILPFGVAKSNPSLTQIVASRIQKRVKQQKLQSNYNTSNAIVTSGDGSPMKKQEESVIPAAQEPIVNNLQEEGPSAGIDVGTSLGTDKQSSPSTKVSVSRKKKNLDFITGRLQYKKKIEALKQKNEETLAQCQQHQYQQHQQQQQLSPNMPSTFVPLNVQSLHANPTVCLPHYPPPTQLQSPLQSPPSMLHSPHSMLHSPPSVQNMPQYRLVVPALPQNVPLSTYLNLPLSHPHTTFQRYVQPLSHHQATLRPSPILPASMHPHCTMKSSCHCPVCRQRENTNRQFYPNQQIGSPLLSFPSQNEISRTVGCIKSPVSMSPSSAQTPIASSTNFKLRQKIIKKTSNHHSSPLKKTDTSQLSQHTGNEFTSNKDMKSGRKKQDSLDALVLEKGKGRKLYKDFELRRRKSEPGKDLKTPPKNELDEYKCTLPGCEKSFRKPNLLDYHLRYYHTAKPCMKRSRSSISVSSTDSNPPFSQHLSPHLPETPTDTQKNEDSMNSPNNLSKEVDVIETSEDDTESGDEYQSVDDCVKCICEDECELGFMIQCEQCFTWQHGECVGYSTQRAVPLFYLCHICSKPKGLHPSCAYNNDYTYYRHGRLPPIEDSLTEGGKASGDAKVSEARRKEIIESTKHVDKEDEDVHANIILATHAMITDLYNIRDVLQNARNRLIIMDVSQGKSSTEESTTSADDVNDYQLEELLKKIDQEYEKDHEFVSTPKPIISTSINPITPQKSQPLDAIQTEINDKNDEPSTITEPTSTSTETPSINSTTQKTSDAIQTTINTHTEVNISESKNTTNSLNDEISTTNTTDKYLSPQDKTQDKDRESIETPDENEHTKKKQGDGPQKLDMLPSVTETNNQDDENITETSSANTTDKNTILPVILQPIKEESDMTPTKDGKSDVVRTEDPSSTLDDENKDDNDEHNKKPLMCYGIMKDFKPYIYEHLTKKEIAERYQLLCEIEKVEDELDDRMKKMNTQLDELESEYISIDRSKEMLRSFKETFKLPDIKTLQKFLHRIKWTSTLDCKNDKKK